ncbi:hypothetical protein BKP45_05125 [Anaerobacillus alkalidiazotrophicus]|uniref:Uncharacterized protein n=1 Tax=Anaerobacillus alkalidiazotrophicus TaxID=472963 RepID=A0A1S2MBV4_9BACI|nr:hypothetical protein [Anaerobacillus alkalidiazotrophicus]OIJ22060.1 hypothetical protein BKP45_05125 [Anaerobacillus alkalidiazotrophicus]
MKLTSEELALMLVHLKMMRKAVKKGLKKTYGLFGHREKMKLYDEILEYISTMDLEEDQELQLSDEHHDMLVSFMTWYVEELEKGIDNSDDEHRNALATLKAITEKMKLQKVV